jgi:hypothetical protein
MFTPSSIVLGIAAIIIATGLAIILRSAFTNAQTPQGKQLGTGTGLVSLGIILIVGGHIHLPGSVDMQTESSYQQMRQISQEMKKDTDPDAIFSDYQKGTRLWWQLLQERIQLRNAVRALCTKHSLVEEGTDKSLIQLLTLAKVNGLIEDGLYKTLYDIAWDTHFTEWNNTSIPEDTRLKEIQNELPKQITFIRGLASQ